MKVWNHAWDREGINGRNPHFKKNNLTIFVLRGFSDIGTSYFFLLWLQMLYTTFYVNKKKVNI